MRKARFWALAFVLASGLLAPESQASSEERADEGLIAMEEGAWEAWKNRDSEYFENSVAADGIMIRYDGRLLGKAAAIEEIGSSDCRARGFSLSDFHVHSVGVYTKILSYEALQETFCGGVEIATQLLVSSTYTLRDGEWTNVYYQETAQATNNAR